MRIIFNVAAASAVAVLCSQSAHAQSTTSGAVRGIVREKGNNELVIGATVVATGPALQGDQTAFTDEGGAYRIENLPPGIYQVVVHYGNKQFARSNVLVQVGKVGQVNISVDTQAAGEVIEIKGRAPIIDQASTKTGSTITRDYTENVPTGRTFAGVLGQAAGSQGDAYGTSFAGATSVENTYIVDGMNTTDPGLGLLSSNLPNEFIQETEVITGGYNAEYGRSTGGVINVITRSGSNKFEGSVFAYWTPGTLVASEQATPREGSSIDANRNLANRFDVGASVGGPIIKDKLWFFVGLNPSFSFTDVDRTVNRQVDTLDNLCIAQGRPASECTVEGGDGEADLDANGFTVRENVDAQQLKESAQTYYFTTKLNGQINQDNQGMVSFNGSPSQSESHIAFTGPEEATRTNTDRTLYDISGKWTSKFFENQTQIDAVLGYHYDKVDPNADLAGGNGTQYRFESTRPLTDFAMQEGGRGFVTGDGQCVDAETDENGNIIGGNASDPFPNIVNCPVTLYRFGGVGFFEDTTSKRLAGTLALTQRVKALGHHTFKGGIEFENNGYIDNRGYSNGERVRERANGAFRRDTFLSRDTEGGVPCDLNGDGTTDADGDGMPDPSERCNEVGVLAAATETRNVGAFIQDSWEILPNVTFNAGIRWERQDLYAAEELRGQIDPATGETIPEKAFSIKNSWAPRFGLVYDWTGEGRSKVYTSWGRFYESIPLDINVRAYGGEISGQTNYRAVPQGNEGGCNYDPANPSMGIACTGAPAGLGALGGSGELVAPGLQGQYLDEFMIGSEYELLENLKVGAAYIHKSLGRVIEDVSSDGGNTYLIVNPGEFDAGAVSDLRGQAASVAQSAMMEADPTRRAELEAEAASLEEKANLFEGVGRFDKPTRVYNALQLTAERRFTKNFLVTASYTYSQLKGNFPGLFSPETNQLDPNLTSMYDLPELMANRYGSLAADRPHLFKIDGFYRIEAGNVGFFTLGWRSRLTSGLAKNTLGGHPAYGLGESYILPRGNAGRTPYTTRFDAHVAYGRMLNSTTKLEAFVDMFNVFNQQYELSVDENYTYDDVNPVVGGDKSDLAHAKAAGENRVISKNPNYNHTFARQAPFSAQFGVRLIF